MALLTGGSIDSIIRGEEVKNPVLKVLSFKSVPYQVTLTRYRMSLTDGVTTHSIVMLATQLNEKIESGELKEGSIIRLENYATKLQGDKKVVVLLALTVLGSSDAPEIPTIKPVAAKPKAPAVAQSQSSARKSMPINLINSYQNNWRIEGRVSSKTPLKSYNSAKGEGKVFSFTLCDSTCDIKIAAFNNEASKYFDVIQMGHAYSVAKGAVKVANATYNNTKCDYEINLSAESEVVELNDAEELPKMLLNFVPIDRVAEKPADSFIDVVGVAHSIMDPTTLVARTTNKELRKRDVILVDKSGASIKITLWDDQVNLLNDEEHPVLVVKGATVKEFNGRTLSCGFNAVILVNPSDIPEAVELAQWYSDVGAATRFQGQLGLGSTGVPIDAKVSTISELACATNSDKGEYSTVDCAFISQFKQENIVYKACATERCNKKLVDLNNGLYKCEKCNTETVDFSFRLLMNIHIIDHTGAQWVTCFQDVAERILGKSAAEVGNMMELEQKEELNEIFKEALFKNFQFKLRAKNETYNDETRMKVTVVDGKEVDVLSTISTLLSRI